MGKRGAKTSTSKCAENARGHYKPSRHDNDIDTSKSLTFVEDNFPVPPRESERVGIFLLALSYWSSIKGEGLDQSR